MSPPFVKGRGFPIHSTKRITTSKSFRNGLEISMQSPTLTDNFGCPFFFCNRSLLRSHRGVVVYGIFLQSQPINSSSRRIASDNFADTQLRSMQFCGVLPLFIYLADTRCALQRSITALQRSKTAEDPHVGAWKLYTLPTPIRAPPRGDEFIYIPR